MSQHDFLHYRNQERPYWNLQMHDENPSWNSVLWFLNKLTRVFLTRVFCSKTNWPGKNPGQLGKLTREKNTMTHTTRSRSDLRNRQTLSLYYILLLLSLFSLSDFIDKKTISSGRPNFNFPLNGGFSVTKPEVKVSSNYFFPVWKTVRISQITVALQKLNIPGAWVALLKSAHLFVFLLKVDKLESV